MTMKTTLDIIGILFLVAILEILFKILFNISFDQNYYWLMVLLLVGSHILFELEDIKKMVNET